MHDLREAVDEHQLQVIVFVDEYPHVEAKKLWESSGRTWEQLF